MSKKILVIIDSQLGFTKTKKARRKAKSISKLIDLSIFDSYIATRFLNHSDSSFVNLLNYFDMLDNNSVRLYPYDLENKVNVVVDKINYSSVNLEFEKEMLLHNGGKLPKEIFLCGFNTDGSVLKTAVDLFEIGVRPIVLIDYCYSNGGDLNHHAGTICLRKMIGEHNLVRGLELDKSSLENCGIDKYSLT